MTRIVTNTLSILSIFICLNVLSESSSDIDQQFLAGLSPELQAALVAELSRLNGSRTERATIESLPSAEPEEEDLEPDRPSPIVPPFEAIQIEIIEQ